MKLGHLASTFTFEAQNRYTEVEIHFFRRKHGKCAKAFVKSRLNGLVGAVVNLSAGVFLCAGGFFISPAMWSAAAVYGLKGRGDKAKECVMLGWVCPTLALPFLVLAVGASAAKVLSIISPELVCRGMKMHVLEYKIRK